MDGVMLTPLKQMHHPKGDVFHAMKKSDLGYVGFGEAYFSTIYCEDIKGWKKHLEMTLNLVVVSGEIEFVIYDGNEFFATRLSHRNYQRLSIAPGLWLAFRGIGESNILLNLANLEHNTNEAINVALETITYEWGCND